MFGEIVRGYLGSFAWGVKITIAVAIIGLLGGLVAYSHHLNQRIEALEHQINTCKQDKHRLKQDSLVLQRNISALKDYYEARNEYKPNQSEPQRMLE